MGLTDRVGSNSSTRCKFRSEFGSTLDARFKLVSKSYIDLGQGLLLRLELSIKSGSGHCKSTILQIKKNRKSHTCTIKKKKKVDQEQRRRNQTAEPSKILKVEYEPSQVRFRGSFHS